jgi:hypothetical protein
MRCASPWRQRHPPEGARRRRDIRVVKRSHWPDYGHAYVLLSHTLRDSLDAAGPGDCGAHASRWDQPPLGRPCTTPPPAPMRGNPRKHHMAGWPIESVQPAISIRVSTRNVRESNSSSCRSPTICSSCSCRCSQRRSQPRRRRSASLLHIGSLLLRSGSLRIGLPRRNGLRSGLPRRRIGLRIGLLRRIGRPRTS